MVRDAMKGGAQKLEILVFLEPANDTAEACAAISGGAGGVFERRQGLGSFAICPASSI